MSKFFLGKLLSGGSKVSPTIKSVKPTTDISGSVKKTKKAKEMKNFKDVDNLKTKKETGKKMIKEAQKELRRAAETKRATQIGKKYFGRSVPADTTDLKYEKSAKAFKGKTGKQLAKEKKEADAIAKEFGVRFKKAGGGMMGRRFEMKSGTPKPKTNVQKIKETFAPKGKIKFDAKKSDLDKSGDLSKYEKRRGMAIAKAMAKRNKRG